MRNMNEQTLKKIMYALIASFAMQAFVLPVVVYGMKQTSGS